MAFRAISMHWLLSMGFFVSQMHCLHKSYFLAIVISNSSSLAIIITILLNLCDCAHNVSGSERLTMPDCLYITIASESDELKPLVIHTNKTWYKHKSNDNF